MSERDLSNAYLRLRALIPGAYDTPHAPTPEQVWETTEAALRRLLDARIRHPLTGDIWVLDGRTGRTKAVERLALGLDGWRAEISAACRDERELCARYIEARAIAIRDHGPVTSEGLLTALAGAQVGALLDAAASLRLTRDPSRWDGSMLAGTNPGDTPAKTGGTL